MLASRCYFKTFNMQNNSDLIEPLLEKIATYSKTSFDLLKLRSLDKTADIVSGIISKLILALVASFFILMLNLALAFWLGEILGKIYYGFGIMAGINGITVLIVYLNHRLYKVRINNKLISQMFN